MATNKVHVTTEHGCTFTTWYQPRDMERATMDCRICGALLLFPDELHPKAKAVFAYDFHKELNRRTDGTWPADGANTGYVEF